MPLGNQVFPGVPQRKEVLVEEEERSLHPAFVFFAKFVPREEIGEDIQWQSKVLLQFTVNTVNLPAPWLDWGRVPTLVQRQFLEHTA